MGQIALSAMARNGAFPLMHISRVRVIGSNSRCVKADIIPQHLPSADLGPYMRTHIETTAVGGRVR